ncbi:anhydro-N-acetylmuramic acid kinase [Myroides sp. LJL119]
MKVCKYNIIGVMSGTSLDGIDLAHVVYTGLIGDKTLWSFEILQTITVPYKESWRDRLSQAFELNALEISKLNQDYTCYLAKVIQDFILENSLQDIDAVSSHGHTVLHRPDLGYTLQIGNLGFLADLINTTVVCDFRVQDVELGGQGAPLVPIGDMLLFGDYQACVNLGGFANISYDNKVGSRVAYDICPVNILLNEQAQKLGFLFDESGLLASKGTVNSELLNELNSLDFYKIQGPKSLGIEFVKNYFQPILQRYPLSEVDILRTLCEHIAVCISNDINKNKFEKVLITGGGAHNTLLIERLKSYCSFTSLVIPNKFIVDYKEAIVFGFLGVLALQKQINVLSSVTGASKDHCSGKIYTTFKPVY